MMIATRGFGQVIKKHQNVQIYLNNTKPLFMGN